MTEKNSELDQATLRLTVGACASLYVFVVASLPSSDFATYVPIMWYMTFFFGVAIPLRMAIKRWPGHFFWRRLFAMTLDYVSLAYALFVGGEGALPLYAAVLWVTLGNGMRFGTRYLTIATLIAFHVGGDFPVHAVLAQSAFPVPDIDCHDDRRASLCPRPADPHPHRVGRGDCGESGKIPFPRPGQS
jgi:hypothetical protein